MSAPTPSGPPRGGRPRKASTTGISSGPGGSQTPQPLPVAGSSTAETPAPSAIGGMTSAHGFNLSGVGPTSIADCEHLAAQLSDPGVPLRRKIEIAQELRDSAESSRDHAFYEKYLGIFIPVLVNILSDEKTIVWYKESPDQRLRHTFLNFLHRLPQTEPIRAHQASIIELMLKLMRMDNEDNALLCIKILLDGFRNHKEQCEPYVEGFLDIVKQLYTNIKAVVEKEFAPKGGKDAAGASASPAQSEGTKQLPQPPPPVPLARGLHSAKVLTECPIAVVVVFQVYKAVAQTMIIDLLPLVMDALKLQPEPQRIAHEEAKARGELFTGVSPDIKNREMYSELLKAQVKTMAFVAYVIRGPHGNTKEYADQFPEACVRLLCNCPPEEPATRKELLVAIRHILTVDSRLIFIPYLDQLLDDRVLVGSGVTCRDTQRPLAYSLVADLIHHIRDSLSMPQIAKIVYVFSCSLNDRKFTAPIQTMCAKLLNTITETIHQKADHAESVRIMASMFGTVLDRLVSLTESLERLKAYAVHEREKHIRGKEREQTEAAGSEAAEGDVDMEANSAALAEKQAHGWRTIEQAMPVGGAYYVHESLDAFVRESKYLFKTLLHTFRSLLSYTRHGDNPHPQPDGVQLEKLFQYCMRCMTIFDGSRELRDPKDAFELVASILLLYEPHVFAATWTKNMDFFLDLSLTTPHVSPILQSLSAHEQTSQALVSILLKYLMTHLEELGSLPPARATACLKLFKMTCLAINNAHGTNEKILVPHLQKLIIGCLTYASKAKDPSVYYQILRTLFRSIGGGRFEALYKEVLPILQEMLDTLAFLLQHASTEAEKDLFTELTLTVPVRLTNLLPHLFYLMKPLVHALHAGPDQVSQGLRTLELCIDNLTAEFLDPTMAPILGDLMQALNRLLRPIPANRQHSGAAIKILGKLGGRTRRFYEIDQNLEYLPVDEDVRAVISFDGRGQPVSLSPLVKTAGKALELSNEVQRDSGLQVLMSTALMVFQEDGPFPEGNSTYRQAVKSLFLACLQPTLKDKALDFIRAFCRRVFALEMDRVEPKDEKAKIVSDIGRKRYLPLTSVVSDCYVETLVQVSHAQRPELGEVMFTVMGDLRDLHSNATFERKIDTVRAVERIIQSFIFRFCALCHEEQWNSKRTGIDAIKLLVDRADSHRRVIMDQQVDFIRALLFVLRDSPRDAPRMSGEIVDLMKRIIKVCHSQDEARPRMTRLIETLVLELPSQSELSRTAAQECLATLAEEVKQTVSELIGPIAKQKLLDPQSGTIYSKPVRALEFAMQVGNIEALSYLVNLRPPFLESTEEFVRIVQEVLALADVDDVSLLPKSPTKKQNDWVKSLRISCLRLLKSAMAAQDFLLNKTNLQPLRSRVIQVYFKHVYSASPEIVDIAHEGMKDVLSQQSKLPKELLQSGLRPILVNLADAKRLSVSGLDGLARFLELLTTYFKVEIGIKLIEHFQTLSDPQMLQKAADSPLEDQFDISRMTRLIKVFRLLPATAVQYLNDLVKLVVDAETQLHQFAPGPFTENIALFLNRYPDEGSANLIENIRNPRYVWTYRNAISSGFAPDLVTKLSEKAEDICRLCFADNKDIDMVMPGLLLMQEMSKTSPSWLSDRVPVLEALVGVWGSILELSRNTKTDMSSVQYQQMPLILLDMFIRTLKHHPGINVMFLVVEAYEIRSSFERSFVAHFLYQQVALNDSVEFRRDVIEHFIGLYEDEKVSWAFKANALRLVINPTLRMYFAEADADGSLVSPHLAQKINQLIWRPLSQPPAARLREDGLLVEVFSLTDQLVQHCNAKISEFRKEIFKLAWMGINLLEPTVKLMAYVLTARFMAVFETPVKFYKLTWTGLLRLKDNENRALYRQALDIMASKILPKEAKTPGPAIPEWAQRVRGVLIEEGHATNQLITVCELLVNHPDLFYDYRELYVPTVTNSLNKMAFATGTTPDVKKLTVDVVELVFKWEKRRMTAREEARDEAMDIDDSGSKRLRGDSELAEASPIKKQRVDRAGTAASASSGGGWVMPTQVKEIMTAHLLRLVSTSPDPVARDGLTKRALDLFKEILGPKGLPAVHVKLTFFNRTMGQDINEKTIVSVSNSSEVIAATCAGKDQQWIRDNLGVLQRLLEKVWINDDAGLHQTVEPLTDKMFLELPESEESEAEPDAKNLLALVRKAVYDGLTASLRSSSHLPGTLFLLRAWLKVQPQQMSTEPISHGLMRVLGNLVKAHTTNGAEPAHRLIIALLDVVRNRVNDMRDQRKNLYAYTMTLIERSNNLTLHRYLLDVMRQWILQDTDLASAGKEKAALLLRMSSCEQKDEQLFEQYLDLIYDIYETEALRGTELTHRLEPAFLLGTRSRKPDQRARFIDKLEQTLPRTLDARLQHLYILQNWDALADSYWIPQILSMLLAIADYNEPLLRHPSNPTDKNDRIAEIARDSTSGDLIAAARVLIHLDNDLAYRVWKSVFPICWSALTRPQQQSFTPFIIKLLSKEYHRKQVDMRPNVIQTFLDGILECTPAITLPPLLVKYLGKTFNSWYVGFEILSRLSDVFKGDDALRDNCGTALSELYAELNEEDMFYGLARSRCVFPETTFALTYEQNGLWPKAIEMYEAAQLKARNGILPFSEDEYCFWEDHWILAAQKLQNWESLTELARLESDPDLLLECAWRLSDWGSTDRETIDNSLAKVSDVPTPRRKTFEAFLALQRAHSAREPPNDFMRILDEAQQVTLRKWVGLPTHTTAAHLPLFQMFQQCVELGEAATVFDTLQMTTQQNLEQRVTGDLKATFNLWRDRLPNFWDDISVWSDLLAWRQHVFQAVTKVFVPLIPQGEQNTHGYRGYHETAWMINRFGEVARRHGLLDVCSLALTKIYSLPNIEITEAFVKLREQALCYFQTTDKFNDGLSDISTTNLMYFAPAQKAEFLTLKGMFIAKLGQHEEANLEFSRAIGMDYNQPKAWAEWGKFNDQIYRERPEKAPAPPPEPEPGQPRMTEAEFQDKYARDRAVFASSAVSCYLQAAGIYNNNKSRPLLLRVLWLLGLDDNHNTVAKAFENYKSDLVVWYWITLIPQLILSLSHREAKQARVLLMLIAKSYPQALFYQLRVAREDFGMVKRQAMMQRLQAQRKAEEAAKAAAAAAAATAPTAAPGTNGDSADGVAASTESKETKPEAAAPPSTTAPVPPASAATAPASAAPTVPTPTMPSAQGPGFPAPGQPPNTRQPWELVDELMNALKTGFPLLTLTMEKMVDQISLRAKPASDEDIYRFFAALLADALQQWGARTLDPNDDGELTASTKDNLVKFSSNLGGDLQAAIQRDFMDNTPKMREYIQRLQFWRDAYEMGMHSRQRFQALDSNGCNLIEYHHTKFGDVYVPGQYVHHVQADTEMVKIARFAPKVELARGHGHCFRRITMIGDNGTPYIFSVQMPAARHCRREERLTQVFRIMNSVLRKRKEARRRNLQFHVPTAIPLAPQLRLVETDSSYMTLQDVYDDYSASKKQSREASIMAFYDRMRQLHDPTMSRDPRYVQLRMEVLEAIQLKMCPETVLTNYMIKTLGSSESLWIMRKQFAIQTGALSFLTYLCCVNNRTPNRFHLSRKTGLMYMTEVLPNFASAHATVQSLEHVPFRLTPNMQHFIGREGIEGVVTSTITAIARSLTAPEYDLGPTLCLFVRDELLTWANTYSKETKSESFIIEATYQNVDLFVRRASTMGYIGEAKDANKNPNSPPVVHAVVTLISQATAPYHLAQMSENFLAWF